MCSKLQNNEQIAEPICLLANNSKIISLNGLRAQPSSNMVSRKVRNRITLPGSKTKYSIDQEFYAESHENVSVAGAIREWFSHFLYSFTLHGLQHAFTETLWIHRVLWTVLLLQAMSCFSFQTFMLLKKYFNYPVTTEVSSKHEAITDFPAVTICNFNIIRKSVAKVNGSGQLFFTSILSQ